MDATPAGGNGLQRKSMSAQQDAQLLLKLLLEGRVSRILVPTGTSATTAWVSSVEPSGEKLTDHRRTKDSGRRRRGLAPGLRIDGAEPIFTNQDLTLYQASQRPGVSP